MEQIFYIIVLIMSVVIHEVAHGYMAYRLGDNTARFQGRLTLNPIKHLDLFGSVILPLTLIIMKSPFLIGWAKPVPFNPNNLRDPKRGTLLVAISGVLVNLFIAIIFGLLIRFSGSFGLSIEVLQSFYQISSIIVIVNLVLAIFNLIPIPPLDGSKILFYFLPHKYRNIEIFLERYGLLIFLFFIIFIWGKVAPIIFILFSLITGISI